MIEALAFDLTKPPPAIVRPDAYWMTRMGDVHDRQKFLRLKSWQQAAVMMERDRIGPLIDGPIRVGQTRGTKTQRAELADVARWVGYQRHELLPIMPIQLEKPNDLPADHPPLKWPSILYAPGIFFGVPGGSVQAISCDPWSIYFNGTNDLTSTGHWGDGSGDTKVFTSSKWVRFEDGATRAIYGSVGERVMVERQSSGDKLYVRCRNDSPAETYLWTSAGDYDEADGWIHWLLSIDSTSASKADEHMINGTLDSTAATTFTTDGLIALRAYNQFVGSKEGAAIMLGDLGELWFYEGYLDASSNVGSFLSGGLPVDLGADGSDPGVSPEEYYTGDIDNFIDNKGGEGATCDLTDPGGGAVVTTTSACMNVGD